MFMLPPAAQDIGELQHAYAGHLYRLRGFVPEGAGNAPTQRGDTVALNDYHVHTGQTIAVEGEFSSPPVLARVGSAPMGMKAWKNAGGRISLELVVPAALPSGVVELIWPSRTLRSERSLLVTTRQFELQQQEGTPGSDIVVGLFPRKPDEVYIGDMALQTADFRWQNSVLQIRVPESNCQGRVLVVAQPEVYESLQRLVVAKASKAAGASAIAR